MPLVEMYIGLDLGQASDFTALCVLRKTTVEQVDSRGCPCDSATLDVVHLHRFDIGTLYPAIVEAVKAMCSRPEMRPIEHVPRYEGGTSLVTIQAPPPRLVCDATGCGRPVVDMFLAAGLAAEIHPMMITAGHEAREEQWAGPDGDHATGFYVPKKDLVGVVQAALQTRALKVVPTLPLAGTLKAELLNFKAKITLSANEVFGEWRAGKHDDLVLAVAMAAWAAARPDTAVGTWGRNPFASMGWPT